MQDSTQQRTSMESTSVIYINLVSQNFQTQYDKDSFIIFDRELDFCLIV
jgi:hypothetical protein